jgi:hypothetical protein
MGPKSGPAEEAAHADAPAEFGQRTPIARSSPRRRSAVLALTGILIAAILGFLIARTSGGHTSHAPPDNHPASLAASPNRSYAFALNAVITRLNGRRSIAAPQLRTARTAQAQAKAATNLAAAYGQGEFALLQLKANAPTQANAAVAGAFRLISKGYVALALAARRGDVRGARMANASLTSANRALNSAFLQLRRLGY